MKKTTKFITALKPIITAFSVLSLCCSTLSYAGDDSAIDLVTGSTDTSDALLTRANS